MSDGPICCRCHASLPHGQANGILCERCIPEVQAEFVRAHRERFLQEIARNTARRSLDEAKK